MNIDLPVVITIEMADGQDHQMTDITDPEILIDQREITIKMHQETDDAREVVIDVQRHQKFN